MHKGHYAPFHPTFWVCWANFWPGYLPWKFTWRYGVFQTGDIFSLGFPPFPITSEAGVVVSPGEIYYQWPVTWTPFSDLFELIISNSLVAGQRNVWWRCRLSLLGVTLNEVQYFAPSPLYDADVRSDYFYPTALPPPLFPYSSFDFERASYHEGGSPWP
jgi:hypothetical protein